MNRDSFTVHVIAQPDVMFGEENLGTLDRLFADGASRLLTPEGLDPSAYALEETLWATTEDGELLACFRTYSLTGT